MERLVVVHGRTGPGGQAGPVACGCCPPPPPPPCAAQELVIDGPFAETKEQLLGFYVIDVADLDAALDVAKELAAANPGSVL